MKLQGYIASRAFGDIYLVYSDPTTRAYSAPTPSRSHADTKSFSRVWSCWKSGEHWCHYYWCFAFWTQSLQHKIKLQHKKFKWQQPALRVTTTILFRLLWIHSHLKSNAAESAHRNALWNATRIGLHTIAVIHTANWNNNLQCQYGVCCEIWMALRSRGFAESTKF